MSIEYASVFVIKQNSQVFFYFRDVIQWQNHKKKAYLASDIENKALKL